MIWVTGDCHGEFNKFSSNRFPEGRKATKDDYVIICGDFGFWHDTPEQRYWFKWLNDKPWTTLFVDGNHENFDALNSLKVEEWNGGKVHRINDSIIHLMRGQVFTLQGLKFFTFGGAASHDVWDGIINTDKDGWLLKAKQWQKEGKVFRIDHYTWWKEEMPNDKEMEEGGNNLAVNNNKVDFIITHDCSVSTLVSMYGLHGCDANDLNYFLQEVQDGIDYKRWYFGHHHRDESFGKEICIYERVEKIV